VSGDRDSRPRRRFTGGPSGAAIAVVVLSCSLALAAPKFVSLDNFQVVAYSVANLAVVAFAQMAVLAAGGMDLSVGAIGGLTAVVVGGLMEVLKVPPALAILAGLMLGALAGGLNGYLVVRTGLSAFIVTLATASVFTGLNLGLTSGQPFYYLPEGFKAIGNWTLAGIPGLLLVMLVIASGLWFSSAASESGVRFSPSAPIPAPPNWRACPSTAAASSSTRLPVSWPLSQASS
jgi:ribose transport system permease protein